MKTLLSLLCLVPILACADPSVMDMPLFGGNRQPLEDRNQSLSNVAAKQGWKAFYEGDLETAIKQFNQAWLSDSENAEAYWGLGCIMGKRASMSDPQKNLEASIRLLKRASEEAPENGRILSDLAFSHTVLAHYFVTQGQSGQPHFAKAGPLLAKSFQLDPKYPPTVANWSIYYFYINDFPSAKKKAIEAAAMGYRLDPNYLRDLDSKIN